MLMPAAASQFHATIMQSASPVLQESSLSTVRLLPSSIITQLNNNYVFSGVLSQMEYSQHPVATIIFSYCIVTAADMVPFVPCQPLAIALGAKLGFGLAFPIAALGQTTAGILAFCTARKAAKTDFAKKAASANLSPEALAKLQEFRSLTAAEEQGDERVLLALIGLRLAPFFPFSAGNYLLGGTTSVPFPLFVIATLIGCIASNFLSVTIGTGGAMLFSSSNDSLLLAL